MRSIWTVRFATWLALGALAAAWFQADSSRRAMTSATAEPAPIARNTGEPAGGAFLLDFSKRFRSGGHYLAEYEMDEEWIKIIYRESNIRFDRTGMTLTLSKTRGEIPFSGGEFQCNGVYGYGRYEVVMKASEQPGAVSSFFIYTGPHFGDPHDEINFELLGRTPGYVNVTYFNGGDNESAEIPVWFDTGEADHLYAFEWAPDSIRWYVDGVKIHEVEARADEFDIPTTTGRVVANLWAGVGSSIEWAGRPEFKRTTSSYRCISHVPLGQAGAQCSDTFHAQPPKP